MVDSGEKKLCTSLPWDFAWCSSFAFVYMQLCRRVLFFKKLNLARNLLDDDDIVFSLVKRYIITLCLRSVHNKKTRF